jgi:hypothetical protein
LFGLVACAADPPKPPGPVELEGMRAKTIVVMPFNIALPLPAELSSSPQLVSSALLKHLEERGKIIHRIDADAGEALWLASVVEVRDSSGPKNFENAARVLARHLKPQIDFDAIIMPALYVQNANTDFEIARWDSANQRVEYIGRSRQEIKMPPPMTIPAASLLIYVFDPEGNPIHSKRTGLELIQHMELQIDKQQGYDERTWVLKDDDPAIEDEIRVRAAVAHALYPYLPK